MNSLFHPVLAGFAGRPALTDQPTMATGSTSPTVSGRSAVPAGAAGATGPTVADELGVAAATTVAAGPTGAVIRVGP
ncbi:MAG: hypothetical protein WB989_02765, partial [Mycobacterium sp.]